MMMGKLYLHAWQLAGAVLFVTIGFQSALAQAPISEDGDIPWESEWNTFATTVGEDPATYDFDDNGLPEEWEYALAEEIVSSSSAPSHYAGMVDIYNANLAQLASENPPFAAKYGYVAALAICRGAITDIDAFSQDPASIGEAWAPVDLDEGAYASVKETFDDRDVDVDGIIARNEGGTDAASFVTRATTAKRMYRLADENEAALLDAAFYAGGQRAALWGTLSNDGKTVAFYGVDYVAPSDGEAFETEIYLVDLGDPSSWRALTINFDSIPQTAITWAADDSRLFVDNDIIDVSTGNITNAIYFGETLSSMYISALPANNWVFTDESPSLEGSTFEIDFIRACGAGLLGSECAGGGFAVEFDGNDPVDISFANDIGSLNLTPEETLFGDVTGFDPFLESTSFSLDAAANPYVAIRIDQRPTSGMQLFWQRADSQTWAELKSATLDPQGGGGFTTYVFDLTGNPEWTGTITRLRLDPLTQALQQILATPVLPNGDPDPSRAPRFVTNYQTPSEFVGDVEWPAAAPNLSRFAFMDYSDMGGPGPDLSNIYVVDDLQDILNAPLDPAYNYPVSSLAPTGLNDGRSSRAFVDANQIATAPAFSQDGKLLLYSTDLNNVFYNQDFFNQLAAGQWDIGLTTSIGSAGQVTLTAPLNQAVGNPTRGGTRLIYFRQDELGGPLDLRLFATSLESCTIVVGNDLGNNDIETTEDQEAADAGGTQVQIPAATVIDFPDGEPQEIQIETPIDVVEEAEIPDDLENPGEKVADAIPVVRDFGPDGTQFNPPIEVTISYTDGEVAGLNEAELKLFLFNEGTSQFDIEVEEIATPGPSDDRWITGRDLVNNTITFRTRTFSKFGVAGKVDTDADGINNSADPDDDNDGIPDGSDPFPLDTDNDGIDNASDFDDDGDGIADVNDPSLIDTDNDGVLNSVDTDDDGDGIDDASDPSLLDFDNDGQTNELDADDDNDGISDADEGFTDPDGDGVPNLIDDDSDGDGLLDSEELNGDPDGDLIPNFLDLDSDGDGSSDEEEAAFGTNPYDASDFAVASLDGIVLWVMLALAILGAAMLGRLRRAHPANI